MTPIEIQLALSVLQAAIQEVPTIATDLQNLFAGGAPTPAQWAALRASVAAETYGQFVPNTALPASTAQS
jgi:hypothetical protein